MKQGKKGPPSAKLWVRLVCSVTLVILGMLSLMGWVLYGYASSAVNETMRDSTSSALTRAQSYLDMRMESLMQRIVYLRLDESVDKALTDYLLSDASEIDPVVNGKISKSISLYRASESLVSSLLLYTPEGVFDDGGFYVDKNFTFEESGLMEALRQQSGAMVTASAQRDEIFVSHSMVIPVMYRFSISGSREDCVLVINIDQYKLTAFLREILPGDGSDICVVDQDGNFVTSSNSQACQELVENRETLAGLLKAEAPVEMELAGQHYLVAGCKSAHTPWNLLYLQSQQQILSDLHQLRNSFIVIILFTIAVLIAAVIHISGTITKPLNRFCGHIRESKNTGELRPFVYEYSDEMGTLTQAYNEMLDKINTLLADQEHYIEKLKEEKARGDREQKLKRQAELQALQAQINPHFLYNTLDSIRWKAEKIGADGIVQMTTSLATLFRISLSRGQEMIPIEQEAKHVLSYLQIQKQRYADKLSFFFDIEPKAFPLYTVKLVLQPLVENAIYHGIKESDTQGEINISIHIQEDFVIMKVTDNGLGIPPDRLELLQDGLASGISVNSDGYGIFNVNERIRLYFGKQYGLTLESEWGKGTAATITIPRIGAKEMRDYVSDSGC